MSSFKHILLADDDNDDIDFFQSAAKESCHDVQVSVANNGLKLLELLENEPMPDIVVLDLNMPLMNGYECMRIIRKNKKYNHVPIMILSTSSAKEDIDLALLSGANYYVVKPESYNALTTLINDLCNGEILNHFTRWD